MSSYLFSQPNLKCTQFAKYKKEYEDQINLAEANIDEAVRQCDAVVAKHEALLAEKGELELALAGTYIVGLDKEIIWNNYVLSVTSCLKEAIIKDRH